eukprot:CAMPEP_0196159548 /NCGR_PEP_ID=MMETSP0910-20130528/46377_1 /TAXON_ID=49265 /ORGANISM="Thalassiosira rotula, Strain GSO102" /LENGTH=895 /DNA_ID=CAMNT_0041424469 /DNA_START=409 /DNA_END=3097 /DNA_ORIENTATION=+
MEDDTAASVITPPIPYRDETSFLLAGEVPSDDDGTKSAPIRQSASSPHPLLSPPRSIPNPYGWMRDESRTNTTVLNHLHAENEYGKRVTHHLEDLRGELYQEFLAGIQETDYTTPALKRVPEDQGHSYWYYARFEEGESYPRYCRAKSSSSLSSTNTKQDALYPPSINLKWDQKQVTNNDNDDEESSSLYPPLLPNEEVYLDVPSMAKHKTYLAVGAIAISPNSKYLAYSTDEKGGETCQIYVKDIESGKEWVLHDYDTKNVPHDDDSIDTITDDDDDNGDTNNNVLECDGSIVWNDESDALYYVTMDDTHRPYRLYRRQIFDSEGHWIDDVENRKKKEEELLMEENDELFNLRISKSFDGKYLLMRCSSKESSEVHYVDLRPGDNEEYENDNDDTVASGIKGKPDGKNKELVCIAKRQPKVLYRVTHCRGYWLVQTNIGNLPNLSLKSCRVGETGMEHWKDVFVVDISSGSDGSSNAAGMPVFDGGHERSLEGVTVFNPTTDNDESPSPLAYAVVTGRESGMPRVWVLEFDENQASSSKEADVGTSPPVAVSRMTRLEFDETAYDVGIGGNRDPNLPYVVISYDSLVTPPSHIAIPLSNPVDRNARRVLKEKEVPGYDKQSYACERTTVRSRDGKTDIPVSLVYHRDVLEERSKNNNGTSSSIPTHLYGYGSYGASIEASFRSTRLPLLKRKVVYALAHTRGGGEMGRPWYDEAKYLTKKNTFNDFVDVARWLIGDDGATGGGEDADVNVEQPSIGKGITIPSKLSCEGRSAGGLLVGASLNQQPELFRAAILGVPFVDVACTMIDASIPLTVAEWEEWGNPNEERYFDYMMSYCPMQNVKDEAVYPSCLITGGLHDPRVQYWEPAKLAAELRHKTSKDSGPVILKMDMDLVRA